MSESVGFEIKGSLADGSADCDFFLSQFWAACWAERSMAARLPVPVAGVAVVDDLGWLLLTQKRQ